MTGANGAVLKQNATTLREKVSGGKQNKSRREND